MNIFLVGGFLGSGKTTAIGRAVSLLREDGKRTGVVTNDQGDQLVDTRFMRGEDIPVKEVTGSCFCCNFGDLRNSIRSLEAEMSPDAVFAESVGSCTDLVATVVRPLYHFYKEDIRVVLSVFADVRSLVQYLFKKEHLFKDNVIYIFEKQLEEADIIVVNKTDLLMARELELARKVIEEAYEGKIILYQSSLEDGDIRRWLEIAGSFERGQAPASSLEVDYDKYGAGEAELAWLDGEIGIDTADGSAVKAGVELVYKIHERIITAGYPIGHLKFLLSDGRWQEKISFTPIPDRVSGPKSFPADPKLKITIPDSDRIAILFNARVQTVPATLKELVSGCIRELELENRCRITEGRWESFAPGYPRPTFRMS
jgi:Ni2+-binding GTPase involved in maturation of urease and hydrogenase